MKIVQRYKTGIPGCNSHEVYSSQVLDSLVDYNINDILYSRKEMIQTGIFFNFNLTFFVVLNTHTHIHAGVWTYVRSYDV